LQFIEFLLCLNHALCDVELTLSLDFLDFVLLLSELVSDFLELFRSFLSDFSDFVFECLILLF
jgi:hypothetical protein